MSDKPGEYVKLTAQVKGEKRSVVLPIEVWEREIALIVSKYSVDTPGVVSCKFSVRDLQQELEMKGK